MSERVQFFYIDYHHKFDNYVSLVVSSPDIFSHTLFQNETRTYCCKLSEYYFVVFSLNSSLVIIYRVAC